MKTIKIKLKEIKPNPFKIEIDGGEYSSNSWLICIKKDYEENNNGFPFKTPKRCFKLCFWQSSFANYLTGVDKNDNKVAKYFHSNSMFVVNKPKVNNIKGVSGDSSQG